MLDELMEENLETPRIQEDAEPAGAEESRDGIVTLSRPDAG